MRRQGFTLAEVLTTLMIIGVVAAITIPIITQSITDKKNETAYKKALSILGQGVLNFQSRADECEVTDSISLASCFANKVLNGTLGVKSVDEFDQTHENKNVVVTPDGMTYSFYFSEDEEDENSRSLADICGSQITFEDIADLDGSKSNCLVIVDINGFTKGSKFATSPTDAKISATNLVTGSDQFPFIITSNGVIPTFDSEVDPGKGVNKGYGWIYGEKTKPENHTSSELNPPEE